MDSELDIKLVNLACPTKNNRRNLLSFDKYELLVVSHIFMKSSFYLDKNYLWSSLRDKVVL